MTESLFQPRRIGVLLNPKSGYVRRHLEKLRQLAAEVPNAQVVEATTAEQITQAIQSFAFQGDDLLVVIGGDGSLQAALTALLTAHAAATPHVLVIPAGTTNMSAADLGARLRPIATLEALRDCLTGKASSPAVRLRPVLKISDSEQTPPQFGLFFGAGAIISGVKYFHQTVRPKGVRGGLGPTLAFIRVLLSLLGKRSHRLLPATEAKLHLKQGAEHREWLVILATSLDKLLLGSTPYWGAEKGPMHFTAIAHRAPRLLATLPFLLRGKSTATTRSNPAYISHNLAETAIEHLDEYLLDGEIFPAKGQLRLSTTPAVRFISF